MSDSCLKCGSDSSVLDTRIVARYADPVDRVIRRRRVCLNVKCKNRWTTMELRAFQSGSGQELQTMDMIGFRKLVNDEVAAKLRAIAKDLSTRIKGAPDDKTDKPVRAGAAVTRRNKGRRRQRG